jgi:hypothetical protein
MAVGEPFGLPDRRSPFGLVDRVTGRLERSVTMRRDGNDGNARLAERDFADPVDDREPNHAEALRDLVGDPLEHG